MKKVSIIIPVYNSSKYLKKCIDSVLSQTYKNIEIICVENKSTDNSVEILKSYNKKLKIIVLNEKGISLARNAGIKNSDGEYIYFLDSDDYIENTLIEELVNKLENTDSDLCYAKYYSVYEEDNNKKEETELSSFDVLEKSDIIAFLHKINYGAPKLYKTKIIKENQIVFPLDLKYEDVPFVLKYISYCKKISMVNKYLYNYVIHKNSETTTIDERVFHILKIVNLCEKIYDKKDLTNLAVQILTTYTIKQRYQTDKKIRNKFIDEAFNHLNSNYPNWKKCEYFKERKKSKVIIETNKMLTKMYCKFYNKLTKTNIA